MFFLTPCAQLSRYAIAKRVKQELNAWVFSPAEKQKAQETKQQQHNKNHQTHKRSRWKSSQKVVKPTRPPYFFCWRLLGLIPGGAPFSQLNRGVKDAMAESTKLVVCQFMTKTCKRPSLKNNTQKERMKETVHRLKQGCKGGLGWSHIDSTYAGATRNDIGRRWLWWNQKGSTYARASVQVASGGGYVRKQIYKVLAFNWVFLMKYWFVRS